MLLRSAVKLSYRSALRVLPVVEQRRYFSEDAFAAALRAVSMLKNEPHQETKLEMYALYKQATQGNCIPSEKPSAFNFVASAKYSAWERLKDVHRDKAKELYVKQVESLLGHSVMVTEAHAATPSIGNDKRPITLKDIAYPLQSVEGGSFASDVIDLKISQQGVATVLLNRPNKGNAFNIDMWSALGDCFADIERTPNAKVAILTGGSKVFSTGMDLSVFASMEGLASKETCEGRKREALGNIIQYLQDAISAPEDCKVPVIGGMS